MGVTAIPCDVEGSGCLCRHAENSIFNNDLISVDLKTFFFLFKGVIVQIDYHKT